MSSRKNVLVPYKIITAGDMSAASITSTPTNIQYLDNIGISLIWTGAPVGTFAVQVSLDYAADANGNVTNSGTWTPLTLNPVPAASGSGSNAFIDINQISSPWLRVVYTKTSGTGALNGYITGKQV